MRHAVAAAVACVCVALTTTSSHAAEVIRIAHIDPISGPFGNIGESLGRHLTAVADDINAKGGAYGGAKLEVVNMDNKSSPQDSVLVLQQAIDQGIRYVTQANGSNVAHALNDAIAKHNARNPDKPVLFLNFGAIDPALTNEKCTYWHFRFDANVDMKLEAFTNYLAQQKGIQKVYLINQDYAFGQSVSKVGKEMIGRKRPDIKIVGDDLHPIGKVKDFSPYITKIKASGADTVLTGNWGNDLSLLVKAGKEAGLNVNYYSLYAYLVGSPTAIGEAGANHVKTLSMWHNNIPDNKLEKFAADYKKKYNEDMFFNNGKTQFDMLVKAMAAAQSTDPLKVAKALEGMKLQGDTGELWMRADDHQLMQPIYISSFTKTGKDVKYDVEGLGLGWKVDARIEMKDTVMPTTCKMQRP